MPPYDNLWRTLNVRPQPQMPYQAPDPADQELDPYITDGDVADMQDDSLNEQMALNNHLPRNPITNETRGVVSLRSAHDTRNQALGGLRRVLGMERVKSDPANALKIGAANTQNAMALEGQRQASSERVAQTNAATQNQRIQQQQQFQAGENEKNRQAVNGRSASVQANVGRRMQSTQDATRGRQASAQAEARAKALEAQAAKVGALGNMFGAKDKLLAQAAQIRQQALQTASTPGASDIAQQYLEAYPGLSGNELLQVLHQTQPDASPEDIQGLYEEILAAQQ